jgi:hypothetical protein
MRWTIRVLAVAALVGCGGGGGETQSDAAVDTARPGAGDLKPLSCPDVVGTAETLAEKAARFDEVAQRWHVPAGQDLWFSVLLQADGDTLDRVDMSDNVGSWSALYSASQAFRYASTRSPEALENLRRAIRGEHAMLEITGVRGLFTRVFINPSLPDFPTAEWLAAAYADCDLTVEHCKRYNEVTAGPWAGWWWKNDVSKDEYAAHMFSMAVAWELVDDEEIRAQVADIITTVGDHLVDNQLHIVDFDGKVTTFGELHAYSMNDYPGFNALLSLSWLRLASVVGGQKYQAFYDDCLLQRAGKKTCIGDETPLPYTEHLTQMGLGLDCMTNWNNHNMAQLAMYALLRHENDPELLATYRDILRTELWDTGDRFPMRLQENSLYTFFYLANRDPAEAWPTDEARAALCTLKTFPASKAHSYDVDTLSTYTEVCRSRGDNPMTDVVIPIGVRLMDNFHWINNPYEMEQAAANPLLVESPEDYLLAYWLGRYYGLITEDE